MRPIHMIPIAGFLVLGNSLFTIHHSQFVPAADAQEVTPPESEEEQPASEEATEAEPPALETALAAYREITMIRLVQALQVNREQVQAIVPIMEAIQQEKQVIEEVSGGMTKRDQETVQRLLSAWVTLQPIPPQAMDGAVQVLSKYGREIGSHRERIDALIAAVRDEILDATQRDAIETREERMAKLSQAERLLESRFVDFDKLMDTLEKTSQLEPQVLRERADALAEKIATDLAGADSPYLQAVKQRILVLLEQLQRFRPQEWQTQRAQIEEIVRAQLGLEEEEKPTEETEEGGIRPDVVAEDAFEVFLQDARGLDLLKRILEIVPAAPEEAGAPEAEPITPPAGEEGGQG